MKAMLSRTVWIIGALALLQTIVLGTMVADRVMLLKTGREIVAPIEPVDPRSLFRGDYVDLNFNFSRTLPASHPEDLNRRVAVYVTLELLPDGTLRATDVGYRHPGPLPPEKVVIRGTTPGDDTWRRTVRFGIEKYFVPEGRGLELEKLARDRKLAAVLAIDKGGRAAIKGLVIDGKRVYDEPLF